MFRIFLSFYTVSKKPHAENRHIFHDTFQMMNLTQKTSFSRKNNAKRSESFLFEKNK